MVNKVNDLKELLKVMDLNKEDAKRLEAAMEKKSKEVSDMLDYFIESSNPISALSNGTVALSNIAMLISDINPVGNEKVFKSCDAIKDYLTKKGYSGMESLTVLLISAALIVGTADIECALADIPDLLKTKKEVAQKQEAKKEAKKEAEDMIDGLFEGNLSEAELAKRIASIIKKSKQ